MQYVLFIHLVCFVIRLFFMYAVTYRINKKTCMYVHPIFVCMYLCMYVCMRVSVYMNICVMCL